MTVDAELLVNGQDVAPHRSKLPTKAPVTSIRLSEEGQQLRKLLAKKLGLSESAVIELALRRLAELEGVTRT